MKNTLRLGFLALLMAGQACAADIHGAGSSFAAPLYEAWIFGSHNSERIEYQPVGSGEGIRRIAAKQVDFGASDAPLTVNEQESKGLVQFPAAVAALVPVVNLPGVYAGELKLSGEVLVGIYNGQIGKWSDSRIAELNPGMKLPSTSITVLHRDDESGSTYVFTDYLSKVSEAWGSKVGQGLTVKWPEGAGVKGGKGMVDAVKAKQGAIGYVEYAVAVNNHLTYTQMKNKDGVNVRPLPENVLAAIPGGQWNAERGFAGATLTNSAGPKSWPITSATFLLLPRVTNSPSNTQHVMRFADWGYRHGEIVAAGNGFISLPKSVVEQVHVQWQSIHDALGLPVYSR